MMPGLAGYDFGDMVRTATCPAAEDERDLSKVELQFPLFEALARGYLSSAGGFLSGIDKRFKAFVIMAGDLSFEIDKKTKELQAYREKVGADKFDAFAAKYSWMDGGQYISHAAPAAIFLQYATNEPFLNGEIAKQYFELVSKPKKLKIYDAQHALNAEATHDRIAFLADQLSFKPPDSKTMAAIPALTQPPWPKASQ